MQQHTQLQQHTTIYRKWHFHFPPCYKCWNGMYIICIYQWFSAPPTRCLNNDVHICNTLSWEYLNFNEMKINMNEPFFLLKSVIHTGYRCIINVSSTGTNRKYYQWKIRNWHNSHSFSVQGRMVDTLMNISLSSHSINWFYDLMVPNVENAATHRCKVKNGRYSKPYSFRVFIFQRNPNGINRHVLKFWF
jgi:hypothetical protein